MLFCKERSKPSAIRWIDQLIRVKSHYECRGLLKHAFEKNCSHLLNFQLDSKSHSVLALERIPLGCRAASTVVLKIRKYQFYRPKSKITLSLPRCTTFETKVKEKKSVIYFNTNYGKWHAPLSAKPRPQDQHRSRHSFANRLRSASTIAESIATRRENEINLEEGKNLSKSIRNKHCGKS